MPTKLYKGKDYTKLNEADEAIKIEYLQQKEKVDLLSIKPTKSLPFSVECNLSLFPNNYIDLYWYKKTNNIAELNRKFIEIIDEKDSCEVDVLEFINNTPAYHIVASILKDQFRFGHQELYLFKEMWLGGINSYRADYVLIGKGSDGYELVFVEFERQNGRITLQDGHLGQNLRSGSNQVYDWKKWLPSHFGEFSANLEKAKGERELPIELKEVDTTRLNFVVVGGRRKDFKNITYWLGREEKKNGIVLMNYDALYDNAMRLIDSATF